MPDFCAVERGGEIGQPWAIHLAAASAA